MTVRFRVLVILIGVALTANLAVGWLVHRQHFLTSGEAESYAAFEQLETVTRLVRDNYVDEGKTSYPALKEGAIRGMLGQLDPFSGYFPPTDNQEIEEQSQGEFGGIGVVIGMEEKQLTVVEPMADSPGEKAGLLPRDRIIEVDGKPLGETTIEAAVRLIKGKPGTAVELTVVRPSTKEVLHLRVLREIIQIPSVTDTAMVAPGIGYTRVVQFTQKTPEELQKALYELGPESLKGLILDLRFNPGGLLQAAQEVCSLFLEEGTLVVFTEGRTDDQKERFYAVPGLKTTVPLVILINDMSASAAEIVAGCLQDAGRALLVGEKTFGKGTVQTPFYLDDGSSIHLTTARYYTPSKRVIHGHGIAPDLTVKVDDDPAHKPFRKPRDGSAPVIEDAQLLAALAAMKDWQAGIRPAPAPVSADASGEAAAGTSKAADTAAKRTAPQPEDQTVADPRP